MWYIIAGMKRCFPIVVLCAIGAVSVTAIALNAPPNEAKHANTHEQDGQRNARNLSPAIQTKSGIESDANTTKEPDTGKNENDPKPDWWSRIANAVTAIATVGLVFVAVIASCIAIKTLRLLGRQTAADIQAASAAKESADALINSERPWLLMSHNGEAFDIGKPLIIQRTPGEFRFSYCTFKIKNFGRSPARIIEQKLRLVVVDGTKSIPNSSYYEPNGASKENYIFAPNTEFSAEAALEPDGKVSMQQNEAIIKQESFVWLCGYWKYIDTFKRENQPIYETRICFRWISDAVSSTDMDVHKSFWLIAGPREYSEAT